MANTAKWSAEDISCVVICRECGRWQSNKEVESYLTELDYTSAAQPALQCRNSAHTCHAYVGQLEPEVFSGSWFRVNLVL